MCASSLGLETFLAVILLGPLRPSFAVLPYPVEAQAPDGDWLKPQMRWHTTGTEFHHAPVFVSWLVMPIRARAAAEAKGS